MKALTNRFCANRMPSETRRHASVFFFCILLTVNGAGRCNCVFSGETVNYRYDDRGRLIHALYRSGVSYRYTYDAAGNIVAFQKSTQTDSDGDFLADDMENSASCPYVDDADSDDDGIPDGLEDRDQDGEIDPDETNPCNADTDGDGIQDGTESGFTDPVPDPDGAGPLRGTDPGVFQPDLDAASRTSPLLKDSDGDGFDDGTEDADRNGRRDEGESDPAPGAGGSISGTLYSADGSPLAEPVIVKAYRGGACAGLELEAAAWSEADTGAYVFENLERESYFIHVEPYETNVLPEWYAAAGDAFDCGDAEPISLAPVSEATGKDIYLGTAASISGAVLLDGGDVPIQADLIYVKIYAQDACTGRLVGGAGLNPSDGRFSVEGLNTGRYFVLADTGTSGYQPEWWSTEGDARDCSLAEAVIVSTGGSTDGIEIYLDPGSRISGTVYQSNGTTPIMGESVVVEAFAGDACSDVPDASAVIDAAAGTYRFVGLKPGTYFLKAKDFGNTYIAEWWSETGNAFNCQQAGSIIVDDQDDRTGVDLQLDAGGAISGTVFEADGETPAAAPLNIAFYLYQSSSYPACSAPLVTFTRPAADGSYRQPLPAGKYYMRINPAGTDYAFAWWTSAGGTISCEDAYYTLVQAGSTASDKNFKLQPAGSISGHIYKADGSTPVEGPIQIVAYSDDPCNTREVTNGSYDPTTGQYVIEHLSRSPYTIFINAEGTPYADEWWSSEGDAYFCFQATHVHLGDNADVTGKDVLLDVGAAVSGKVYQKDGVTPVDQAVDIGIYPEDACGGFRKITTAASDPVTGQYVFIRQGPGNYALLADMDNASAYLDEWWSADGDAFGCEDADVFALLSGVDQTGKDFQIDRKSTLSGTLYKPDGNPMNIYFYVYLYGESPCLSNPVASTRSNGYSGTFSFSDVRPGSYRIRVDTGFNTYASEWWSPAGGNVFACADAGEIVVSSGQDRADLDIHMDVGAKISGTLYQEDNVTLVLDNTKVNLYRGDPCNPEWVSAVYTNSGTYEIDALPPGTYYLKTVMGYYMDRWWSAAGNARSCEDAEPIVVDGLGDIIETTDFRLEEKASISGGVYQLDGITPVTGTIRVYLYNAEDPEHPAYVQYAAVEADGAYKLRGINAGTYFLRAYYYRSDYVPEWWSTAGGGFDVGGAEAIVLTEGRQLDGIHFRLHAKGRISGKVLTFDGSPIDSETIYVFVYTGESGCSAAYTGNVVVDGTDGTYQAAGLEPGTYFLQAISSQYGSSAFVPQWWSENEHASDCSLAEGIAVAMDQSIGDKDFSLYDCSHFADKAANDFFDQPVVLPDASGTQRTHNFCASAEEGEPDHAGVGSGAMFSLWWRWTATGSGTMVLNTEGSAFDTVLAVYTGDTIDTLSLVVFDNHENEQGSSVSFPAEAGQTFNIAVDTLYGETGSVVLNYQRVTPGDVNIDETVDLADAIIVLQTMVQRPTHPEPCREADVDGDDRIGAADAVFILQKLAENG